MEERNELKGGGEVQGVIILSFALLDYVSFL